MREKQVNSFKQKAKICEDAEEIEGVMNSSGGTEEVMKRVILEEQTTAADAVRNVCEEAQGKLRDVRHLEQSILELHRMFVDFALLTEEQGSLLDHIETHIVNATDAVIDGNQKLADSIELQKAARKKQCCLIITFLVVVSRTRT